MKMMGLEKLDSEKKEIKRVELYQKGGGSDSKPVLTAWVERVYGKDFFVGVEKCVYEENCEKQGLIECPKACPLYTAARRLFFNTEHTLGRLANNYYIKIRDCDVPLN